MWFPVQLLSSFFRGGENVFNSVLVAHYDKRPYVLQWYQSLFTLPALALLALIHGHISSEWALLLFAAGVISYVGDALFFVSLRYIDVSLVNIAWALQSLLLSVLGYFLFHEVWTGSQTIGAVLVLSGIASLSCWHRSVGNPRALLLLPVIAVLFAPFLLAEKAAIQSGETVFVTFFWAALGRELFCGILPLCIPRMLRAIVHSPSARLPSFHLLNGTVIGLFYVSAFLTTVALSLGPVSLVSIVGNVHPFFVLLLAWILWKVFPAISSREIFSARAVRIKILSFLLVFSGLALLAPAQ